MLAQVLFQIDAKHADVREVPRIGRTTRVFAELLVEGVDLGRFLLEIFRQQSDLTQPLNHLISQKTGLIHIQ